jgi:hypothetical protein
MMPTRVIAAPRKEPGPKGHPVMIVPTDVGDFPLRELADMIGMPYDTLRCRIEHDKWQRAETLKPGHLQVKGDNRDYTPGSYLPCGSRKRDAETIPVGKVERHATIDDWRARRKAFLKTLPARDAEYRDYLKAHKAMCR